MISSNTRASRSRYSSPANQQRNGNGSGGEAARSSNKDGSRALMKRWLEPPVQSKASFEDAGLVRFGVLENMAPLGSLPKSKKTEGGGSTGVRKIILRPTASGNAAAAAAAAAAASSSSSALSSASSAAAFAVDVDAAEPASSGVSSSDAAATPEAPVAATTPTPNTSSASSPSVLPHAPSSNIPQAPASQPASPTQSASRQQPAGKSPSATHSMPASLPIDGTVTEAKGIAVEEEEEEEEEDYDPRRTSPRRRNSSRPSQPKKGRPSASVRRSSLVAPKPSSPEELQQHLPMSSPLLPSSPQALDSTEKVIETAVQEALRHYRYPTAYALRSLWDLKSDDATFVRMMQDVFTQTADQETTRRFARMMERTKRLAKMDDTGFTFFEHQSGMLPSKPKALAAPYATLIQRPETATTTAASTSTGPEEQVRGETRPTKKIKIVHRTAREDTSASASATAAGEDARITTTATATATTTAASLATVKGVGAGAGAGLGITETLSWRKRGRRDSQSSESSLSSVMSLSSPEMTHRRPVSTAGSGPQASPSARPRVKINSSRAKAAAAASAAAATTTAATAAATAAANASTEASNEQDDNGLQAPNALQSNGLGPKTGPQASIFSGRRQSPTSDLGQDEKQDLDLDQGQGQDAQELHGHQHQQDHQQQPSSSAAPAPAGSLDESSSPVHTVHTMSRPHHHHHNSHHAQHTQHPHHSSGTANSTAGAAAFLSINNANLDQRPNSPSPPQSPTTAVVEERQRHRQQDKIRPQSAAGKKDSRQAQEPKQLQLLQRAPPKTRTRSSRQSQPAASTAPSPSPAVEARDAAADASMPGLITAPEHPPPPPPQEVAARRCEAKKITNGYTATESSIRDASLSQLLPLQSQSPSLNRDRDVTPTRSSSAAVAPSTSTRRSTRQSATASATVPPPSTRATRSAHKRSAANDENADENASPGVFSIHGGGDGSSVAGSRAVTPTNLRPAKKQKTGLRIKLSPVKKKGGTAAGVPRPMGEAQSSATNGAAKDQADNDEYCSACGNAGDVVCCDGCPRSFHFECVGMDPTDDLPDEWFCNDCLIRRFPSRVPIHSGLFGGLLNNLEKSIPRAFSLPKRLQNRFEGVRAGADGDYEDITAIKAATKKRNTGYEEAPDFFKQRDDGEAVLCHDCQKPASRDRAIIPCSACPLYWHTDCLDPPLAIPPVLKTWRCPAHTDELLMVAPPLAPAHKFRKIKGADSITPALSRGLKNNGHVEIDWTEDILPSAETENDNSGWRDYASFGRTYKIPARGVVLDFIEQIRKKGANHGTALHKSSRTDPYLTPPVEDMEKSLPPTPAAYAAGRRVEELQASLILTSLKQTPADGVEQLTSVLLSSADPSIISLIAQGNAENIARDHLADTDKQSLRALLAHMDVVSASIRTILGTSHSQPAADAALAPKAESKDLDAMDADHLITEPTPPSTIDHAEGAMDYD